MGIDNDNFLVNVAKTFGVDIHLIENSVLQSIQEVANPRGTVFIKKVEYGVIPLGTTHISS